MVMLRRGWRALKRHEMYLLPKEFSPWGLGSQKGTPFLESSLLRRAGPSLGSGIEGSGSGVPDGGGGYLPGLQRAATCTLYW